MVMSAPPAAISAAAMWLACCADPHCASTVVHAVVKPSASLPQPGVAGDVRALLARLGDATADDLVDQAGIDAGTVDHCELRDAQDLGRLHPSEPAVALPDRGPDGFDDDGRAHGPLLHSVWTQEGPGPTERPNRICDGRV